MGAGGGLRTTRAAVFAAVCVLLAALGHAMMSGASVPWWALAVAVVACGGTAWCLAGRERGLLLVSSVVVAAQSALHECCSYAQALRTSSRSAGGTARRTSSTRPRASTGHTGHAMHFMTPAGSAVEPTAAMDPATGIGH